jgi:transcriptional adapter 3
MPSTHRTRSSTPIASTSRDSTSIQIASIAASTDIPSSNELASLARILRDRKKFLKRKLEVIQNDEQSITTSGKSSNRSDSIRRTTLLESLDNIEFSNARRSRSKSPTGSIRKDRPTPLNLQTSSGKLNRNAVLSSPPSASQPLPTGDGQRPRIKVKRESERDRSIDANSIASGSGSHALGSTNRAGSEASPGPDADWDDEGPSRPGRAFFNKRKRHRGTNDRDGSADEYSQSEVDSPAPPASSRLSGQGDSSWLRRESMFSSSTGAASTHKLKLNPTAQTAHLKRDSLSGGMLRRPSGLRGDDFGQIPLTPFQIQQAAMWELPKRTPETFIPKEGQRRYIRPYPIKPDEVDVDFSSMDWRERDKERDRLEAAAAASAAGTPVGPGPGQAIVKDTAVSRARDRKQDQVPFHTFQQWSDGWFRTLTEEDLAWLSSKSEDMDLFSIPSLGRHYKEIWEEEEASGALVPTVYLTNAPYSTTPLQSAFPISANMPGRSMPGNSNGIGSGTVSSHMTKPPKFDPRQLKDYHLFAGSLDEVRGGPFTERLLSVLLPTPPPSDDSGEASQQANQNAGPGGLVLISGHGGGNAGASQDMADYEDRLMRELKAIDVIGNEESIDWSDRTDDEISSTLRKVQNLLRKQIRINELRKSRLFEIAMDRMAYQDYVACLTSVEREIESGWLKRQQQIRKSMSAQKKKKGGSSNTSGGTSGAAAVAAAAIGDANVANSPAAAGTPGASGSAMVAQSSTQGFIAENRGGGPIKPQFSDQLISAMEKRRQLLFAFEPMFAEKPLAKLTPKGEDSIFADLNLKQ